MPFREGLLALRPITPKLQESLFFALFNRAIEFVFAGQSQFQRFIKPAPNHFPGDKLAFRIDGSKSLIIEIIRDPNPA